MEEANSSSYHHLSPAQQKLFELRLKLNKCRKENNHLVAEEEKRSREGPGMDAKREREAQKVEKENEIEEIRAQGLDPVHEKEINQTAAEAEYLRKREKSKEKNRNSSFGWEQYNDEAQFKSYERRIRETGFDKGAYQTMKESLPEEDFYKDANSLSVGTAPPVPKENIDKMTKELEAQVNKRRSFSRKRASSGDNYIDYINSGNKSFNNKIARAFDKYTTEIKQNIERGTAV